MTPVVIAWRVNIVWARSRACAPRRARSSGSSTRRRSAPPSAPASPGGTMSPVTPSSFTNGTPVGRSVDTTGVPQACASTCTAPNASLRSTDGRQNTSAAWYQATSSSSGTGGMNVMRLEIPDATAISSIVPSSGPVPITTRSASPSAIARHRAPRVREVEVQQVRRVGTGRLDADGCGHVVGDRRRRVRERAAQPQYIHAADDLADGLGALVGDDGPDLGVVLRYQRLGEVPDVVLDAAEVGRVVLVDHGDAHLSGALRHSAARGEP